jgi:glycine/D-amino acid oxidase-like deaminating enzyme
LCEEDTGYFDPNGALRDLARACHASGTINLHMRTAVSAIETDNTGRASGIKLADGSRVSCGAVVNAAGPWCNALNKTAGLDLPWQLAPVRIQVLHKDVPGLGTPQGGAFERVPAVCDLEHGVYFRPQLASQQILISTVRPEEERETVANPDEFNRAADPEMRQRYLGALHERLPTLEPRGRVSHYSALYTSNMDDGHPIIGATPVPGLFVANGFSGHGFKISPMAGALLARAITGLTTPDFDSSSDLDFLSPMRKSFGVNKGVLG